MSQLAQLLVTIVTNAGGKLSYPEVRALVPPDQWRRMPQAFKEARANGALDQEILWDGTSNTHNYFVPSGSA